jgi:hypothetical protein
LDHPHAETARRGFRPGRRLCWLSLAVGVIALTAALTLSSLGVAAVYTDVPPEHAFARAIATLTDRGCVTGFADGRFHPDASITRQQFAKALALTLGLAVTEGDTCSFVDVQSGGPGTLYPDNFIGALAGRGVIVGTGRGGFSPNDALTLGQAEAMLTRAARLLTPTFSSDALPRLPDAPADPATPLTRGQAAYLLAELLTQVLDPITFDPGVDGVSGVVRTASGSPVAGATVSVRATSLRTASDSMGRYVLRGLDADSPAVITAWGLGYYIGASDPITPGARGIDIALHALPSTDNPDYKWVSGFGTEAGSSNCQRCHSSSGPAAGGSAVEDAAACLLPFDEWVADAHAGSATNPRFLSMYSGTDLKGNRSPLTRHIWDKDYGLRPLPPDPNLPYYGPGYKLDFTTTAGNCATCHVPVAALDDPYGIDPTKVAGVAAEGIGCDFCHKVSDVRVDPATGLPYENAPGVLSLEMMRPSLGHQFFAGPYMDVAPGEDTYSSLQKESLYCASCHTASFWGTKIYDSYGEWLASPYSDPVTGRTCQDCHMLSTGATLVARAEVGGNARDAATVRSHLMPGAADVGLLRGALSLDAAAQWKDGRVSVTATVTNDKTGHHVPTDSPLRQVLLVVRVTGPGGQLLQRLQGPVLPEWTGAGADAERSRYAGLPGTAYAKILREPWTGIEPSGAYWNPTVIVSDTRLAAFASDTTSYSFAAPPGASVSVRVTLLYRRAFLELAEQKGWNLTDIVMQERQITLTAY